MRRKIAIDTDELLSFYPLLEARKVTQADVAKHFDVCIQTLRATAKRRGHPLPSTTSVKTLDQALLEKYSREEMEQMTQYEIAEELKTSQPLVFRALRRLDINSKGNSCKEKSDAHCKAVCDYVAKNGGCVVHALDKLKLPINRFAVYVYARRNNIDLKQYRFAYRTYGHWLTLPCHPKRVGKSDHILKARCQLCGQTYDVRRINLVTGASTRCVSCSAASRGGIQKVRCMETGEVFRSIRAWASEVESSSRYQSLRLKISKTGSCTLKGKTYQLMEPPAHHS